MFANHQEFWIGIGRALQSFQEIVQQDDVAVDVTA
jgi:hypothetical protein